MSIHYLLDGYNIIHQTSVLNLEKLEDQRQHLIRFIENRTPQGSIKNNVTIVFDGSEEVYGGMSSSRAKIIFSQGESADDKIKKIVAEAGNSKNIIVVTDDRDIQYAVRALGAKVSSVKEFLNKGQAKKIVKQAKKSQKEPSLPGKYISKSDEFDITSEMEQIWLKPNDD